MTSPTSDERQIVAETKASATKSSVSQQLATEALDALNLEQALVDFEIANARVVDLTRRVTEMTSELLRLRSEVGDTKLQLSIARGEADALRSESHEIKRSLAYRVLRAAGDGRAALRRR